MRLAERDEQHTNFVAVDVETANPNYRSICQVGLAKYENGSLISEWKSYVDPEDDFHWRNVSLHRIDESIVEGAPTFADLESTLREFFTGAVLVCHGHFDRVAIPRAAERYDINLPVLSWLDSASVARRTWKQCARKGYGLPDVCAIIGYEFKHHDALEDAKAAAQVLLAAIAQTGLNVDAWLARVRQPIDPTATHASTIPPTRDGNPEGDLHGEVLVFTGSLRIPRREAADLAARVGCRVDNTVTMRTTILVVGDQDLSKLAGHKMSSKHRKVEQLIEKGSAIRILSESDFEALAKISIESA